MATRKIVSQTDDTTQAFPHLDRPLSKVLTEDATIDGVDYKAGQKDPSYTIDPEYIQLVSIGDRMYYSVHGDYTAKMLTPTEQNDYVIEKTLDGNFVYTLFQYNHAIAEKCKIDPEYAKWLGLPEFNPEIHKTDLDEQLSIDKKAREAADLRWISSLKEKEEYLAARGLTLSDTPDGKATAEKLVPPETINTGHEPNPTNNAEEGV